MLPCSDSHPGRAVSVNLLSELHISWKLFFIPNLQPFPLNYRPPDFSHVHSLKCFTCFMDSHLTIHKQVMPKQVMSTRQSISNTWDSNWHIAGAKAILIGISYSQTMGSIRPEWQWSVIQAHSSPLLDSSLQKGKAVLLTLSSISRTSSMLVCS